MDTIDVVIPTAKNIEKSNYSIIYTLRSILSQDYPAKNIFVVNNSRDENIRDEIYAHFGEKVHMIDGVKKSPNISYARNLGASMGNSEIILFMDDDVILGNNNQFSKIANVLKYNDFCCGAHRYWATFAWEKYLSLSYQMNHNLQILKSKSFLPASIERISGKKNFSEYSFIGNLGAIRRSVFRDIGGFDEEYEGWLYQDTDLMMRLCVNNYNYLILHNINVFCYHLGHPADKEIYRKVNFEKYQNKQDLLKIRFNCSNFFGRFDDDSAEVITPYLNF